MSNVLRLPRMGNVAGEVIEQFTSYQQARGFSRATIKRRATTLRSFSRLIDPGTFATATDSDVLDFLLLHRSPRTQHAYRSDLSTFYKWAVRRAIVPNDPTLLTDSVRVPKSLPRPVPAAMIPFLVSSALDDDVQLMVALAAFAGLRVAEIASICAEDVNLSRNILTVRMGKGSKDRVVPLHPVLKNLLIPRLRAAGPLFEVKADTIGRKVAAFLRTNGVDATAHKLRATFGTELAESAGGNIVMVQRLMGHESPVTTMGYVGWGGGESNTAVAGMYAEGA